MSSPVGLEVEGGLPESEMEEVSMNSKRELLQKEELRDSKCCRFCGLGSGMEEVEDLFYAPQEFIPIFEKHSETFEGTLDLVINRYLPIKVLTSDPFYPRVICLKCYECLESTIQFFDRICEGQKLLAKILNQFPCPQQGLVEKKYVKFEEDLELQFSEMNPVVTAPKRRGRPRKDPTRPSSSNSDKNDSCEVVETRAKRQSRPPIRYIDESAGLVDQIKQENLNEERDPDQIVLGSLGVFEPTNNTDISMSAPNFSSQENILAIGKLNVILDGDEETDAFSLGAGLSKNPGNCETTNGKDDPVIIGEGIEPEHSDGDESVKLSDLVGRQKRTGKRKRKYKKRPLNPNGEKFPCQECQKSFNHSSSLLYHKLSAHDATKKFVCEICNRGFTHKQLLNSHKFVHSSEKTFACGACPSKFKSRASLYTHKKSIHSAVREFTCDKCGYQFSLKSSLKAHMRIHTNEKPFVCEFCQKAFTQRSSLREHRRTHTGERPYGCNECDKSFTTASQLRSHKFCHSDQKTHLCQICGKGFSHAENFKYHMRRHTGERPIECQICKKQFLEPWSLKKHLRLHSGEKPYKCDKCKKVFADPSNFAKHKKIHLNTVLEVDATKMEDDVEYKVDTNTGSDIPATDSSSTLMDIDFQPQICQNSSNEIVSSGDTDTPSIVQILNSDSLTYESLGNDGEQQMEQVIYVYSGDNPLFALSMSNSQQSSEMRTDTESVVGEFSSIDSSEPFATTNPGEFESHYYSLETVDGTTIAVPISITPGTNFDSPSSHTLANESLIVETPEFKPN